MTPNHWAGWLSSNALDLYLRNTQFWAQALTILTEIFRGFPL